jgi:hypothetical protein
VLSLEHVTGVETTFVAALMAHAHTASDEISNAFRNELDALEKNFKMIFNGVGSYLQMLQSTL